MVPAAPARLLALPPSRAEPGLPCRAAPHPAGQPRCAVSHFPRRRSLHGAAPGLRGRSPPPSPPEPPRRRAAWAGGGAAPWLRLWLCLWLCPAGGCRQRAEPRAAPGAAPGAAGGPRRPPPVPPFPSRTGSPQRRGPSAPLPCQPLPVPASLTRGAESGCYLTARAIFPCRQPFFFFFYPSFCPPNSATL